MDKKINVTLSMISKWWNENYYRDHYKPALPLDEELERVYLERKRFLFENFGEFSIGEENPLRDGKYVNGIMKWCVDFIPFMLGVPMTCIEEGFWQAEPLGKEELASLKPVDIASLPFAEWLVRRRDMLRKKYGSAEITQLVEGSVNVACRMRGEEFYCDLILDRDFAQTLLHVITETVINTYRFFAREFDLKEVFLANCSNVHIGPETYNEMCLANDIHIMKEAAKFIDAKRFGYLHNCDSCADRFLDLYSNIPYIKKLDGSYKTDIRMAKEKMPDATFTAFFNPVTALYMPLPELKENIIKTCVAGADELLFANIDPATDVQRLRDILGCIMEAAAEAGVIPEMTVVPFAEDELEWAFPEYQGTRVNRSTDDWRLLIPRSE